MTTQAEGKIVVVPIDCSKCKQGIEIECQHVAGFGYLNFYRVDCPHCGAVNHRQLPGDIVNVFKAGDLGE